jgi:hypothetical protein
MAAIAGPNSALEQTAWLAPLATGCSRRALDGQEPRQGLEVLTQPATSWASVDPPGGQLQHDALLITHGGVDLRAVQNEERFHRRMPDTLVAVDKRVVSHERKAESRRLFSAVVSRLMWKMGNGVLPAPDRHRGWSGVKTLRRIWLESYVDRVGYTWISPQSGHVVA